MLAARAASSWSSLALCQTLLRRRRKSCTASLRKILVSFSSSWHLPLLLHVLVLLLHSRCPVVYFSSRSQTSQDPPHRCRDVKAAGTGVAGPGWSASIRKNTALPLRGFCRSQDHNATLTSIVQLFGDVMLVDEVLEGLRKASSSVAALKEKGGRDDEDGRPPGGDRNDVHPQTPGTSSSSSRL